MAPEPDVLRSEIERTKEDLAGDLTELKQEAGDAQKKLAKGAGIAAAAYVGFKVVRFLWRRIRS